MSTLFEDQLSKAERYRKHQLYKNMLDEQIRYKNQYRESDVSYPRFSTPMQNSSPNQVNYQPQYTQARQPVRQEYTKPSLSSPIQRLKTGQEERTEKYLDSCEQIIKNLRELKQKRKERQQTLHKLENVYRQPKKQPQLQEYHPRNSYFSSSVKNSREPFRQDSIPKNKQSNLKPLRTLEPSSRQFSKQKDESNKKNVRVTPNNKKLKKIQFKDKIQEKDQQNYNENESMQPLGIKQKQFKDKSSRKKLSPKARSKDKLTKNQQSPQNYQEKNQSNIRLLQNKQVYECISQIVKYFKFKNDKSQEEKKKAQLVSQQTQVDLKDQEDINQKSQRQRQNRQNQLKLKALIKLRQLNEKGRQFVQKMRGEKEQEEQRGRSKNKSPQEPVQMKSPKSDLKDQVNQESLRQKSRLSTIQRKIHNEEKQNEELFKAIVSQLNRQEIQNESLTNCLRQLSLYLKDHNQQLQTIRNSRAMMMQSNDRLSPPIKEKTRSKSKNSIGEKNNNYRSEEFPKIKNSINVAKPVVEVEKQKAQHTKQEQSILKQAFLKRLKKARLRGKLLNEKIQTYKKQHSPPEANNQQDKLQINPQLSPEKPAQKQQTQQYKQEAAEFSQSP